MPSSARRAGVVGCDVIAYAAVRASTEELPSLRRSPGMLGDRPVPPAILRHADEQTVVGLAAVLRAVREGCLDPEGFIDWSVVAAPRFLGASAFEVAFPQFLADGAWGVSPHLIPNHSLHSPSGTVSQALQAHGPNLGVGGSPGCAMEAFLTAAALLDEGQGSGVWVILSGRTVGGDYEALALALARLAPRADWTGTRLRIVPGAVHVEPAASGPSGPDPLLSVLAAWLGADDVRAPGDGLTFRRADCGHSFGAVPGPHSALGAGQPLRVTGTGEVV